MGRDALLRTIDSGREPLLLVVAPSGYGKTNLLSEWARITPTEVVWMTCKDSDAEPAQFWNRLVAVAAANWPTMGSDAPLILSRHAWVEDDVVSAFAQDLADVSAPGAIVVDDCQLAESSQRALAALARVLPPNLRIVLASQHNPVFSTARLRLEEQVAELRAGDLAFTRSEAEELFALEQVDLEPGDVERLLIRTEGWPAGLRMAVLAVRHAEDRHAAIEAFASTTKATSDYLANEVLDRLPPELTEFMTRICILDEFDAELCEAVSAQPNSQALLDRVVANDLFIYQVDQAGQRFRFHHMFAAFLQARLKSLGGGAFQEAQERATAALHLRGDRLGALRHAMAVADVQRAAELVMESMARVLEVDDAQEAIAVARAWLSRFGDAAIEADPEQLLQLVFVLATTGQRAAEYWLSAIDRVHPDLPARVEALRQATWAQFYLNRGDSELAVAHNRRSRKATETAAAQGPVFAKLAELPLQEAAAHLIAGNLASASAALLQHSASQPSAIVDDLRIPAIQRLVLFLEGDLAAAYWAPDQALRTAVHHNALSHGVGLVAIDLVAAGLHLERREHDAAVAKIASARQAVELNARPVFQTIVYQLAAQLATSEGNYTQAMADLTQARTVLSEPSAAVLDQLALAEFRVAVALAPGNADRLVPLLPEQATARLLQARLAVGRQQWVGAEELLQKVEPATIREQVEWGVLSALAVQRRDLAAAHGHLREALIVAKPHQFLDTILQQGSGVADLLQSLPAGAELGPDVDVLLASARTIPTQRALSHAVADNPLTDREVDVLRLLSSRLTTQEIAGTLFVSPNTLKSHLKSIYRKLQVASRSDALREGQARGLL